MKNVERLRTALIGKSFKRRTKDGVTTLGKVIGLRSYPKLGMYELKFKDEVCSDTFVVTREQAEKLADEGSFLSASYYSDSTYEIC